MHETNASAAAPAANTPRPLPEGFRLLNLYPLVFDPDQVGGEHDLEGHAFALEVVEHGREAQLAFVVKSLRETRAWDPMLREVVNVPAGVAVRVVLTPAMHRLRPMVENAEAVPHLLFRPEWDAKAPAKKKGGAPGRWRLRVAEGSSPVTRAAFEPPTSARA